MFLDFNTGTSIDNMYIVTGIKHSISPGRFTTDLTLSQRDIYSQFMAEAGAIQEFFKSIDKFKGVTLQSKNNSNLPVVITVPTAQPAIQNNEGVIASNGALTTQTGSRTGRSPNDRFIVKESSTENDIDWGVINKPFEESKCCCEGAELAGNFNLNFVDNSSLCIRC